MEHLFRSPLRRTATLPTLLETEQKSNTPAALQLGDTSWLWYVKLQESKHCTQGPALCLSISAVNQQGHLWESSSSEDQRLRRPVHPTALPDFPNQNDLLSTYPESTSVFSVTSEEMRNAPQKGTNRRAECGVLHAAVWWPATLVSWGQCCVPTAKPLLNEGVGSLRQPCSEPREGPSLQVEEHRPMVSRAA